MLVLIAHDVLGLPAHQVAEMAVEGELVSPVVVPCGNPRCDSCPSAWYGLVSHRPTETAMVVERPGVTEADLRRRIREWLKCQGVIDTLVDAVENGEYYVNGKRRYSWVVVVEELIDGHLREIRTICENYPIGAVVSRCGSLVSECRFDDAA